MRGNPRRRPTLKPRSTQYYVILIWNRRQPVRVTIFFRFQKRLNGAYAAEISDFRAGDHGHFDG